MAEMTSVIPSARCRRAMRHWSGRRTPAARRCSISVDTWFMSYLIADEATTLPSSAIAGAGSARGFSASAVTIEPYLAA